MVTGVEYPGNVGSRFVYVGDVLQGGGTGGSPLWVLNMGADPPTWAG